MTGLRRQVDRAVAPDRQLGLAHRGPGHLPPGRQGQADEPRFRPAGRARDDEPHLSGAQPRLGPERDLPERRRGALDLEHGAVAQPAARGAEEEAERLGPAVVVEVPVLHEQVAQRRQEHRVAGAVGRQVERAAPAVAVQEARPLAADEGPPGHALGELAVEPDQRVVAVVAAQQREHVAQAVEDVDARLVVELALVRRAADHPHREPAVLPQVVDHPGLALGPGAEDAGAEDVGGHQVVVAAHAGRRQRLVGRLVAEERDGDERRLRVAPLAPGHRVEDRLAERPGLARRTSDRSRSPRSSRTAAMSRRPRQQLALEFSEYDLLADVAGVVVGRQQAVAPAGGCRG